MGSDGQSAFLILGCMMGHGWSDWATRTLTPSHCIWIFLSDVSGEWKDNILFLHMSSGSIYTLDSVIKSPHHHWATGMPTSSHSVCEYFFPMYPVNRKTVFYSCTCLVDQYTFWTMEYNPQTPIEPPRCSHQVIQYVNISFRCIRWLETQYSIPVYIWWINIHFW